MKMPPNFILQKVQKLHIDEDEVVCSSSIINSKLIQICFLVFFVRTVMYNVTDLTKRKMFILFSSIVTDVT